MLNSESGRAVLRGQGAEAHRVTYFELFFDLVYVFAVTQLSHGLLEHLSLIGALQTFLLLLAVWWAWVYTTWATNWIDPDSWPVRLMLIGLMGAGLIMAAAVPEAFGDRGLMFALAYAAIQVIRSAFVLWAVSGDPVRRSNFQRIVIWNAVAGVIWIVGGLVEDPARTWIWIGAIVVDYAAPAAAFWVPGLGRSRTEQWTISGSYIAERFKLFVILALGESILVTGITLSGLELTSGAAAAFGVAFIGSVAFWWIYFDRAAEAGTGAIESSANPGRLARSAYTYLHLPIVAGIIVSAVADELVITHPEGTADPATVAVSVIGPGLFLIGHALYQWASVGVVSIARAVAIGALAVVAMMGPMISPLALASLTAVILVAVAAWGSIAGRRRWIGAGSRP